jgi:diguanylate cyclase (GGDEF)-like protein
MAAHRSKVVCSRVSADAEQMRVFALAGVLLSWERRALYAAVTAMTAIIAFAAAHAVLGVGGSAVEAPIRDWGSSAVYVLVAAVVVLRAVRVEQSRAAWTVIAVGVSLYGGGNLVWSLWLEHVPSPPIPSICDAMWLALYPAAYIGVALLARHHWRAVPAGVWLDGILAGLGMAAVGAAVIFGPVLRSASGSFEAVATNLAYPIADLLLAALVVAVLSLRGWRVDRGWALLGAGFIVLTAADAIYLLQVAGGASASSPVANLFYMAGVALLALAAWQLPERTDLPRTQNLSTLLVPAAFGVAAVAVLAYDHFQHLSVLAFGLSLLTVIAGLLRTALAFRELRTFSETRRQAVTDDLTGLPNRRLFQRRLEESIARSRPAGDAVAVLILDLDRFKELNDTLGHQSGDELLRQIGPRLASVLRPVDTLARLTGDEFGIVLDAPGDEADALIVADKIRDALAEPFEVQDLALRIDASVGIALFPTHAKSPGELLRRADVAMYQAKTAQTRCEFYAPERDTHSRERLALAAELERAVRSDEIEVHFQPKADAHTRAIVGVEALARWRHPVHGLLQPNTFIALAETTGLIRSLTRRVIHLALAQCAAWRRDGLDLHVAVNVAAADLLDAGLPAEVAAALERHQLPSSALVLEVTENSVLSDPVRIHDVLVRLGDLGVCLSLDDFGTGFSSLAHLKGLPVGEIKIDRSFVTQMASYAADSAIVHTTIQLAHRLGKRVVAEGVEDEETWRRLATAGCHLVQGYALSRPQSPQQLTPLLEDSAARLRGPAVAAADAA